MPLRDHFRSPLDDLRSWDELHGGWPMVMVQHLSRILPEPYFAGPGVYLGRYEVDIGAFDRGNATSTSKVSVVAEDSGGTAMMTYAPPVPTSIVEPRPATSVFTKNF
jgi:hypothetical protein